MEYIISFNIITLSVFNYLIALAPSTISNHSISTACVLWSCHIPYQKDHSLYSFVRSAFFFAVRSFSSEEVLSELIQPPGPHCSSPGRIPPASGTFRRFLVDRQKGGSLQFFISCSGKGNFLTMFLLL